MASTCLWHRIPTDNTVATIVQYSIDKAKELNTFDNNPNKLLFVRYTGTRKGRSTTDTTIREVLNNFAGRLNITDEKGDVFKFTTHAFRHSKAVELINNGMNLLHVQKWFGHASASSTLQYARILDETLRDSWEKIRDNGLFCISKEGIPQSVNCEALEKDEYIDWQYIKHNLDAVRMPLGYCLKPKHFECVSQLVPCLECRNLCTTVDFIPKYETDIIEIKSIIDKGKALGRTLWVEKNQLTLERYQAVLDVLKSNKTRHKAGKKGREYIGEERNNGKYKNSKY